MSKVSLLNGSPLEAFDPQRVVAIRKRSKKSLKDFGASLGFTGQYIGLIERGQANPSLRFIERLSGAYGVKPSSLFRKVG